jgi:hydrogenase maturation protease
VLTIIGCGNPAHGDDGFGPHVARRLAAFVAELARSDVRVLDAGTHGGSVMLAASGGDALVIVDAVCTGVDPGAVYEVPGDLLFFDDEPIFVERDFRWDQAIAAGRQLFADEFPDAVSVLLVEVEGTDFGLELSAPVRAAAEHIVARIERLIRAYPERAFA